MDKFQSNAIDGGSSVGIEKRGDVKKGINERAAVTVLCTIYKACTSNCLIDQRILIPLAQLYLKWHADV